MFVFGNIDPTIDYKTPPKKNVKRGDLRQQRASQPCQSYAAKTATCLFETSRSAEATVFVKRPFLKENNVDLSFDEHCMSVA